MVFSDPKKPLETCKSESCDDCPIRDNMHCHFSLKDWLYFLLISSPPLILGGAGIYYMNAWFLIPWLILIIAFFGFIEIRVMCSHCPHYAGPQSSLSCRANYGAPKFWKYRPWPMTTVEKTIFFTGFTVVWGYPLAFLIPGENPVLLLAYLAAAIGFFIILTVYMCSQCMNFACPLNRVDEKVQNQFFEKNPVTGKAWRKGKKKDTD